MPLSQVSTTILAGVGEIVADKVWSSEEAALLWGGDEPCTYTQLDDEARLQVALSMTLDDLVRAVTVNQKIRAEVRGTLDTLQAQIDGQASTIRTLQKQVKAQAVKLAAAQNGKAR